MTAPSERLLWLDIAKGIGIVLVVAGHVLSRSGSSASHQLAGNLYLFHMPLFFLLAGVTLRPQPWRGYAVRKAIALLLPYAIFLGGLGAPALIMSCGFNHAVPDLGIDRCPVMAVKLLTGGSLLGGIFGVFWFIPCLLGALILAQFVLGESGSRRLVAGIMLVGLAYTVPLLVPQSTAILALGAVPMACCLVLTGYALRKEIAGLNVPLLALCAALSLMVIAVGAPLDMKVADYGPPVLGMVGAVALSCLLIRLSSALTQWPKAARLLSWLGARSLTVLYLHQVVHLGLRHFGVNNEGILLVVALALPAVVHTSLHRLFDPAGQALLSLFSRKSPPSPVRLP